MDDTTLFWVVLHLLVVFTEQLFAALVSSGGNSRLAVATLDDGDLIVWTGARDIIGSTKKNHDK